MKSLHVPIIMIQYRLEKLSQHKAVRLVLRPFRYLIKKLAPLLSWLLKRLMIFAAVTVLLRLVLKFLTVFM